MAEIVTPKMTKNEIFNLSTMYLTIIAKILKSKKRTHGGEILKFISEITKFNNQANFYAWRKSNATLYEILNNLEKQGIIKCVENRTRPPKRKEYELVDEQKLDEMLIQLQNSIQKNMKHLITLYTSAFIFLYEEQGIEALNELFNNCIQNVMQKVS